MHDPHFPFSRAKPLLPTLKFLILEYNMCSVKVWGKGMPLTTQPSYPLNASQSPSQWGSVLGSSPEAMSLHWVSACHLALGAIVSICHPRLYEKYSWVENNWIFPIERNLVRMGGPLKTNPASTAHMFMALYGTKIRAAADMPSALSSVGWALSSGMSWKVTWTSSFSSLARTGQTVTKPQW